MRDSGKDAHVPSPVFREICRLIAKFVSRPLWRIRYHSTENIPAASPGGFIIASNHQTYLDPVWISIPIKQDIRYLAWDRALHWPVIGRAIRRLGAMPVSLEHGSTPGTMIRAIRAVKNGSALMIFPEGEREFSDGKLLEFRNGAAQIACKTRAPILPVTVVGGDAVWPREYKFPRLGKVDIHFHPLINPVDSSGRVRSAEEITGILTSTIAAILEAAR